MVKLVVLGSSNAISSNNSENTHMAFLGQHRNVLVDCASNPLHRLGKYGVNFDNLSDLVLTHFHPDHVSGVPLLLMDMWLRGRRKPIDIYGLHHTLDRIEGLMGMYSWENWPDFFPVAFHRLPLTEMIPVLESEEFLIYASPVRHMIPTIGLRMEIKENQKVIAYSCDTEPCSEVIRLASGADILIHEASGESVGHSSAEQAGEIARRAEVGELYLIHYPTGEFANGDLIAESKNQFSGEVKLATDLMTIELG
jgi:ribonuclease Z